MRKSRLSRHQQYKLVEHFVSGSTARCAAAVVGVNKSTAAYYFHRLRELIALHTEQEALEVFGGEIEVDESYGETGFSETVENLQLFNEQDVRTLVRAYHSIPGPELRRKAVERVQALQEIKD